MKRLRAGGRTLAGLITATLMTAGALAPSASANTVLWVHGAGAGEIPLSDVLRRVPPGYSYQEVEYPAGMWPWNGLDKETGVTSIAAGVVNLDAAIRATMAQDPGKVLVIGESLGSMVVDQELRELVTKPDLPDPSRLRFEVIAAPARPGGFFSYRPIGHRILLTGTRLQAIPVTPYDVTVLKLQYDGVASWPDRPWNLVADAQALFSATMYHGTDHYGLAAQALNTGQPLDYIVTRSVNKAGGTTTTYEVQQETGIAHALEPYFPKAVGALNKAVTAAIELGYSRLTPNAGPHLHFGRVRIPSGDTENDTAASTHVVKRVSASTPLSGSSSPRAAAGTSGRH